MQSMLFILMVLFVDFAKMSIIAIVLCGDLIMMNNSVVVILGVGALVSDPPTLPACCHGGSISMAAAK